MSDQTPKHKQLNERVANVIESHISHETDMRADISIHDRGYAVTLIDMDWGEPVGFIKIFPNLERAQAYADEILGWIPAKETKSGDGR